MDTQILVFSSKKEISDINNKLNLYLNLYNSKLIQIFSTNLKNTHCDKIDTKTFTYIRMKIITVHEYLKYLKMLKLKILYF